MAELVPAGVLGTITYHIITLAIETGQANDEVRRSLELVRTCDRDLQHLISLRDEHLDILERKPIELERINLIIEDAHKGLLEVGRIVEKCRPEANRGKLPFARRGRWVLFDSKQFNSQVPVINGHHQAVLTEITFLRQIALHIPTPVQNQVIDTDTKSTQKKRVGIDNINLLGSLMGRKPAARHSMPPPQASPANSTIDPHNSQSTPPSLPPKPPSYQDPNFIATSVAKHISLADIQASRGSASTIYDAFTPVPYTQPPSFNAVPPQFVQEQLSTGTTPAQYRSPSPFSCSEPQSQYQGSTAYPSTIPSQPTPAPSYHSTQTQWSNEQTYQAGNTAEHAGGGERRGGARHAGGFTDLSWESQPASEASTTRETPRSNLDGRNVSAQATPTTSFQNWDNWNRY
ncbi:hypothetical protein MRS44_000060 [Fusarium solani]|uniref:Uncharacterized protein n=1 Tax=Fusarium solani TaxID=169388 RepID=A0A9P9K7I3_FUSSL|nr:uncharacterized protein B0J15DRAFT_536635 [Fusarium solani]KAH7250798.1 hypothetical protein B0J15DRAFT_536635 [Fusarium solani]KAJ3469961.1 hypothetical protein MRS44_000060 [Fusarium solani]